MNSIQKIIDWLTVFFLPLDPVEVDQNEIKGWEDESGFGEDQMSNPDSGFWRPNHIMMGENDIIGISLGGDGL